MLQQSWVQVWEGEEGGVAGETCKQKRTPKTGLKDDKGRGRAFEMERATDKTIEDSFRAVRPKLTPVE